MKKYIKPQTEVIELSTTSSILAGSLGVTGGDIGFGGTDIEGSLEPQSRRDINVWGRW